jgi:hypothetical protein
VRLEVEEREDSAGRFFEGSLMRDLQAVWRDFAALGSLIAVDILSRSADAMASMLEFVS